MTGSQSRFRYRVVRVSVRSVTVFNLTVLLLDQMFSPAFYNIMRRLQVSTYPDKWFIASSLILPLLVVLERQWMLREKSERERRGIVIDAVFSGVSLAFLLAIVVFARIRPVFL